MRVHIFAAVGLVGVIAGCGTAPPPSVEMTFASPKAPDLSARAAAAVRLRIEDAKVSLLRSGVMIDPRGYLLTSFTSVGVAEVSARGSSRPGTLYAGGEQVLVEVFDGPYSPAPTTYVARVVRADLRLNLALLRITEDADGPLDESHRFAAVATDAPVTPQWGAFGWARTTTSRHSAHTTRTSPAR